MFNALLHPLEAIDLHEICVGRDSVGTRDTELLHSLPFIMLTLSIINLFKNG